MFTRREHVHFQDLKLAVEVAKAPGVLGNDTLLPVPTTGESGRLALLFMLRGDLEHLEAWRNWLTQERGRARPRVSLYFHLADGLEAIQREAGANLLTLPGARLLVPTVATGWCELMAAEVALLRAAVSDDPATELFVLLPHDSVPLAPLDTALASLLGSDRAANTKPRTRICPAGVRGLDVPAGCAHAIEPHWSRSLLMKHHQWMALSRQHALRVSDARALQVATTLFREWFLGEPLCSDEVLPLLLLALPEQLLHAGAPVDDTSIFELPLFREAARGLRHFEAGLRAAGAASECITYAPWPGCRGSPEAESTRAKSPVVGGGLLPRERDELMRELARAGVLFGRKLGLGGGDTEGHMALIREAVPAGRAFPTAPPRLLPEPGAAWGLDALGVWLKWQVSSIEALLAIRQQVALAILAALVTGWLVVCSGGISKGVLEKLVAIYSGGHVVIFFISVVAFSEYSLLAPLQTVGYSMKEEM